MLPFDAYPDKGRRLLGRPKAGTGSSRTGYGLALRRMTGQSACAYCDIDLVGDYHRWLLLTVDHVVPQGEARRLGIPAAFYEDAINLVLACSGCNGYLNRFRCVAEPGDDWSEEQFFDLRDSVFQDRHRMIAVRRDKERAVFDELAEGSSVPPHEPSSPGSRLPGDRPISSDDVATFVDDDAGYLSWLAANPDGFVVNTLRTPNARYLALHRSTCGTINGLPARGSTWTDQYIKVCSRDLAMLHDWARQTTGGTLTSCGRCRPPL